MADMDVFAAMGLSGFGKAAKKRDLDPSRFDVAKRQDVPVSSHTGLVPSIPRVNHPPLIHRKNRLLNKGRARLPAASRCMWSANRRRSHSQINPCFLTGRKKKDRTIVQMQMKTSPSMTPLPPRFPPRLSFLSLMRQRSKSTPKSSQPSHWTRAVHVCSVGHTITTVNFGILVE